MLSWAMEDRVGREEGKRTRGQTAKTTQLLKQECRKAFASRDPAEASHSVGASMGISYGRQGGRESSSWVMLNFEPGCPRACGGNGEAARINQNQKTAAWPAPPRLDALSPASS